MNAAPTPDRSEITRALNVLHPDGVVELRALFQRGRKKTSAGYFDAQHRADLVEMAAKLNSDGAQVYITMNALDAQLLGRYANRIEDYAQATATDTNVTRRHWLLVDIDPVRPKDTSSTGEQLEAAMDRGRKVYRTLAERGWPKPVVAESGNGAHLLYRIDLENNDASRELVKACLEALAVKFDDSIVKIDKSVFNAARIVKLHGTIANKGDNVPSAPWRLSKLRNIPERVEMVSQDLLEALAAETASAPRPNGHDRTHTGNGRAWTEADVSDFLRRGGLEVLGEPASHDGSLRWRLKRCPFNPDHGATEAAVFLKPDGRLGFRCQHNSCADKHWSHLRELVDGPRDQRQGANGVQLGRPVGVVSVAGSSGECRRSVPEPLRRPLPPADPYPVEALGPILSAAVRRAHEIIRAPAAICGQSFLAAASLAAQAHADVEIDGRRELLSLFVLTIGESGERKSGVDSVALMVHREFERKALKVFEEALQHYENALTAHEAAKKLITKQRPKEIPPAELADYIQQQLERLGKPPMPPKKPIYFTASPTLEGLHKLYVGGRPSIGLFHDDAGEFIGGHAMSDDNRLKSAAGLSKLWDRGEFDRVRAGDGANKYFGRRVASHLMIQPVVAERVLSDDILTQQGLLARTLLAWPQSTIGERPYVETDISMDPALLEYQRAIAALLERPRRFAEGSQEELDPPTLRLTPEAKQVWVEVHDAIEADQKDGAEYSSIRPWASKAPAQILRIAGVLTIVEQPNAAAIEVEMITRAATLMKYYLGEAARIVGTAAVPEHVRHAEALLEWCRRERKAEVYSREVLQFGPNAIRSVDTFDKAITALERTGWAIPIEDGKTIDGKHRRRVWTIRLEEAS